MDALGTAFSEAQNFDEARHWYSEAVRIAPDYPQGRFNLGTLLLQLGRNDEAIEHLRVAVSLIPGGGSSEAQQNLGAALLKSGRYDEAIDCFRRLLAAAPGNSEMHQALGLALLNTNPSRPVEAALEFQTALKLNPKH